jgi:pimeloyl-ACP methyl ester carboxylesterase
MTNYSHETAPTRFVEAEGVRFAYRRFGKTGGLPLLLLQYFNANMDDWDPFVTNGFALDREVILFDNAGVGSSGGETPGTVLEMTQQVVAFCRALGLKEIDAVGFSLGGMIVQQLSHNYPKLLETPSNASINSHRVPMSKPGLLRFGALGSARLPAWPLQAVKGLQISG